jgi:hypothetical protein
VSRFDSRLEEALRKEFDAQKVETPRPHQARYARLTERTASRPRFRVPALATGLVATAVLLSLGLVSRSANPVDWERQAALIAARFLGPTSAEPAPAGTTPRSVAPDATPPQANTTAGPAHPNATHANQLAPRSGKPPTPAPSLSEDFDAAPVGANPPAGWTVTTGQWDGVVADTSHFMRHSFGQADAQLAAGSPVWTDYSVSADIRPGLLAAGDAGVAGRYQGPGDYYECGVVGPTSLQLWRVKGGQRQVLDSTLQVLAIDLGRFHTIKLNMRGNQLTCSLDGVTLLHATDGSILSGRVALAASSAEGVDFDNVRVTG